MRIFHFLVYNAVFVAETKKRLQNASQRAVRSQGRGDQLCDGGGQHVLKDIEQFYNATVEDMPMNALILFVDWWSERAQQLFSILFIIRRNSQFYYFSSSISWCVFFK